MVGVALRGVIRIFLLAVQRVLRRARAQPALLADRKSKPGRSASRNHTRYDAHDFTLCAVTHLPAQILRRGFVHAARHGRQKLAAT